MKQALNIIEQVLLTDLFAGIRCSDMGEAFVGDRIAAGEARLIARGSEEPIIRLGRFILVQGKALTFFYKVVPRKFRDHQWLKSTLCPGPGHNYSQVFRVE